MVFVIAALLGLVGGIFDFLPVSATGHLVIIEQLIGLDSNVRLLFSTFAHFGSAVAMCYIVRRDFLQLTGETIRMTGDMWSNLRHMLSGGGRSTAYMKVVRTTYRKIAVLIFAALVPTVILGAVFEGAAKRAAGSLLYTGTGLLVTGLFLMVTGRVREGGKTPKEFRVRDMFLTGVLQGFSVFPGVSRSGIVMSGEMLGGFGKKTAVRISCLLEIPTCLAALVFELIRSGSRGYLNGTVVGMGICCMIGAYISARFCGKRLLKFVLRTKNTSFAVYCMAVGIAALLLHFAF